jgi:tetratricopeptide (TPR) repeat protein
MGKPAEARTAAGPISDQTNGRALYLTLMGRAAQAEGNHDEAIAAFQFARAADPRQWAPVNGMVRSMTTRGDFDGAGKVLHEIILQNPADVTARLRLGDVLSAGGDLPAALDAYNQVLALRPGDVTASIRAVGIEYLMGNEERALGILDAAAQANRQDSGLRVALAFAYQRAKRFKDAIAVYEALNAENGRNVVVANNLAALIADHDYQDPARVARAIKMMEPLQATDNANVIDTIGWLHVRAGRTAEALSYLKRAVALDPRNPELKRHLAEAYQLAGDPESARRYLVEAN